MIRSSREKFSFLLLVKLFNPFTLVIIHWSKLETLDFDNSGPVIFPLLVNGKLVMNVLRKVYFCNDFFGQ